jgi:hypothetical protein
MSDRRQRMQTEWNRIEEQGKDLEGLAATLSLSREDLQVQVEPLQLAMEGGCVEYKTGIATEAFRALEGARFRSLSSAQITDLARQFALIVYITTAQRMICDGTLVVRERATDQPVEEPEEEEPHDIKKIIAEVQERVKKEPELKARQPVKNILMQLARYSREVDALKEATARTPPDKRPPIVANFQRVTETIYASIRRNYDQLAADELSEIPKTPQHILLRFDLKPLIPLCRSQAKVASDIRSSLLYIREEQIGIRELLAESAERHNQFNKLLEAERAKYVEIGGTEKIGAQIALGFRSELEKRIIREIEYY